MDFNRLCNQHHHTTPSHRSKIESKRKDEPEPGPNPRGEPKALRRRNEKKKTNLTK